MTGVPQEILLAIAKVESGFNPRAIGPFLPQFAGTQNEHALGMMQFLPSTYSGYAAQVDAITGKNLGMMGIWDAESSIYAAALYLRACGAPANMRAALFAYNNADWYVDLILAWAAHYAGGPIPDPNMFIPGGGGPPIITVAPENPLQPVAYGHHLDTLSPIPLFAPVPAGETWYAGGDGSFYGSGFHNDAGGMYYAIDLNKGVWPRSEPDEGSPVLAAADGLVHNVYATVGGGWTVEIYHRSPQGSVLRTLYLHLKEDPRQSVGLKVNQVVPHGTIIGHVGNTGATSTGAHLHFGLDLWTDGAWISIRPEPMEGQFLQNGGSFVSHNTIEAGRAFNGVWTQTDQAVLGGKQQTWLWGPQPFSTSTLESYGTNGVQYVQYWDKGRMQLRDNGRGGFIVTVGRLGWEMLTGKLDLGGGQTTTIQPARIPLVGLLNRDSLANVAGAEHWKLAPTYADAAMEAAHPTADYSGHLVTWQLLPGGAIAPLPADFRPAPVMLRYYDPVTQHNVADIFANWYETTFLKSSDGDPSHALIRMLGDQVEGLHPGRPLTDPFWVQVTIDGADRWVMVQIFERWVLTYSPDNPAGWQVELGNVGLQYYQWRYEEPVREALLNQANVVKRRRTSKRARRQPQPLG